MAESKKTRITKRTFVDGSGEVSGRAGLETQTINVEFVDNGHNLVINMNELSPGVLNAAAAFGLVTSITNAFGGMKDVDEMIEAAEARLETLSEGQWAAERQTGERTSDLVEAICRVQAEAGVTVSDEARAEFAKRIKDESDPLDRKTLLANARVAAAFEAIKLERAQARAAKKAQEAEGSSADLSDLLG